MLLYLISNHMMLYYISYYILHIMFILKSLHDLGIFGHATAWGTPRNDIAGPGGQAHLHQQAQQFANSFLIRKKKQSDEMAANMGSA